MDSDVQAKPIDPSETYVLFCGKIRQRIEEVKQKFLTVCGCWHSIDCLPKINNLVEEMFFSLTDDLANSLNPLQSKPLSPSPLQSTSEIVPINNSSTFPGESNLQTHVDGGNYFLDIQPPFYNLIPIDTAQVNFDYLNGNAQLEDSLNTSYNLVQQTYQVLVQQSDSELMPPPPPPPPPPPTRRFRCKNPHVCPVANCGRVYGSKHNLDLHQRSVHLKHKPFRCAWPGCKGLSSANRWNICAHVRRVHFGLPASVKQQVQQGLVDSRNWADFVVQDNNNEDNSEDNNKDNNEDNNEDNSNVNIFANFPI